MKIQNLSFNTPKPCNYSIKPSFASKPDSVEFTSNQRIIRDEKGQVVYRNTTWFFRDEQEGDLNWNNFTDHLIEKYKDVKKVNIYSYACSDGSEPYSLAMLLITKLGEKKAQKFLPIIAKDFDKEIIRSAKTGIVKINYSDINRINKYTNNQIDQFFTTYNVKNSTGDLIVAAKPKFKQAVRFEQADIFKDYKTIKKENSVVMVRNVWPYFEEEQTCKLAENINKQIGKNSMCVLGRFDIEQSSAGYFLLDEKLKPSDIDFCYER